MICYQAVCEIHGPMRHYAAEQVWKCHGWDGEGCQAGLGLTDAAVSRVGDGKTRWPGVRVEISTQ